MMRINLLAQSVGSESQPEIVQSPAEFQARVFGMAIGAVVITLSAAWWLLGRYQAKLDSQRAAERAEAQRLAGIAAENKRHAAELQEIDRRIAAVQSLENDRRGPVVFLVSLQEAVNRAPALNLLTVGPRDGRLSLNGAASSVTAVADLVSALQSSTGYQDVPLREYHEDDDKGGRVRFKFSLDFRFEPPASEVAADLPAGAAKPAGAPLVARPQPVAEKRHG